MYYNNISHISLYSWLFYQFTKECIQNKNILKNTLIILGSLRVYQSDRVMTVYVYENNCANTHTHSAFKSIIIRYINCTGMEAKVF